MVSQQVFKASKSGNLSYLQSLDPVHLTDKIVDDHGANCCHYAARGGSVDVLRYLIQDKEFDPLKRSKVGSTPHHDAAAAGKLYALQWLLQHSKPSEDDQDGTGATILHLASRFGHTPVIEWILDNTRYDVMKKSASGALPIHFACVSGNLDAVKVLLKEAPRCINLQTMNGVTPIYFAAQCGHLEMLRYLVEKGGIVKINCYDGMTCLHAAAQRGHLDCVEYLIRDQKCNPNERDFDGATALHFAASNGHTKVVEWLLQAGNAKVTLDNLGGSPLHNAAEMGKIKVVRALLENGCSPDITDNNGLTAAELAENCWHEDCAKEIKAKTGPSDSPNYNLPPESPAYRHSYNFQCSASLVSSPLSDSAESLINSRPCSQSEETGECESASSVSVTCQQSRETGECESLKGRQLAVQNTELSAPEEPGYTHRQRANSDLSSIASSLSSSSQAGEDTQSGSRQGHQLRPISFERFSYQLNNNSKSEHPFQVKRFSKMSSRFESDSAEHLPVNGVQDASKTRHGNDEEDGSESVASSDSLDHEISRINLQVEGQPPPPPPMITPDMLNVVLNKRPKSSTLDSRAPVSLTPSFGSRPGSNINSPTRMNHDFVSELKKTASSPNLKRTKKPNETGQMTCIYSFGGPGGVKKISQKPMAVNGNQQVNGDRETANSSPTVQTQGATTAAKQSNTNTTTVKSEEKKAPESAPVSDYNGFMNKVPDIDSSGSALPPWKKQLLARQMAEKAQKEMEEKKKEEEKEARFKGMPAWKRQLLERKEAEAKAAQEKANQSKKKTVNSATSDKRAPFTVEVQSLKS